MVSVRRLRLFAALVLLAASAPGLAQSKLFVNEFFRNGNLGTTDEWAEIVLREDMTAAQLEAFYVGDSTGTRAAKFSGYRFANMAGIAATFKAGTIIVVSGATGPASDTSYDPTGGDWNLTLRTGTTNLTGNGQTGDLAGTDVVYVDTNGTQNDATLSSSGFAVTWPTATGGVFGDLANVRIAAPANTSGAVFNADFATIATAANWTVSATLASMTPGLPNGGANTTYIDSLRTPATPTLSIDDVTQSEGNAGATVYTFTVTLTNAAANTFTVDFATQDGTAQDDTPNTEDEDYVANAGTLNFAGTNGETHTVMVTVNGDTDQETDESFDVVLSNVSLAGVGIDAANGIGTGTIQNDDVAMPTLTIDDVSKVEGSGGGTTTYTFTVSLDVAAGAGGVTFDIATAPDSALGGGDDYADKALTGQTIAAGNTSYSFDVVVDADDDVEGDEAFFANVANITGALAGDVQGTGTVQNDDAPIFEINQIQGPGAFSPIVTDPNPNDGTVVGGVQVKVVGAVVTAITRTFAVDGSPADQNGFFMQSADIDADSDPLSSEGILVFTNSAPTVSVGDVVTVVGQAQERFSQTQIATNLAGGSVTVTGAAALPTPVEFSDVSGVPSTDPAALSCPGTGPGTGNNADTNFECFEGMRVSMPVATIAAANQRRAADLYAEAYVTPYGERSRREAGLLFPLPTEPGNAAAGQWDGNPEVIEIDADEAGLAITELTAGSMFGAIGVIGFSFGDYEFYPTTFTPILTQAVPEAVTATAGGNELTVGSFNAQHLCDNLDDDGDGDYDTGDGEADPEDGDSDCVRDTPVSGAGAFDYTQKLRKVSAYVRTVLNSPDVLGLQEVDSETTLVDLANRIVADGGPTYQSFLVDGNDPGGIDVGFMVRTDRISGASVEQFYKNATWPDPVSGPTELLHDRPPLLLRATFNGPDGPYSFAVLNNHTKSIGNVDDSGAAAERDRAKRFRQARDIATLVQEFQTEAGPFAGQGTDTVPLILVGDYNAFEYTDGHADVVGLIAGTYDDAANECNATLSGGAGTETCNIGANIVDPPLFNAVLAVPASERISYLFTQDFNAVQGSDDRDVAAGQTIDHILLARTAQGFYLGTDYGVANNAAATETNRALPPAEPAPANAIRSSDHDGLVAYLDFNCTANAELNPDGDTVCGMLDNCPEVANDDQADGDDNGIGNACDVNNAPTIDDVADTDTAEDQAVTVNFSIADVESAITCADVTGASSNQAVLADAGIQIDGAAQACSATLTPVADASGTSTVTLTVDDGALDADDTFVLTVNAVNDAPSFAVPAGTASNEDAGAQAVAAFATAISAGPADEGAQTLSFNVTGNTNPGLFAVAPAIATDGTLTYTADANANGTATITVTLSDDGGGSNTSAPQSFVITVTAQADAPAFIGAPYAFTVDAEDPNGTAIGTVTAVDPDALDTLTYSIQSSNVPGAVTVHPTTGAISVADADLLTPLASPIVLTVRVQDAAGNFGLGDVSITVTGVLGDPIFGDGFE